MLTKLWYTLIILCPLDIDECISTEIKEDLTAMICDKTSTICSNKVGSYMCSCRQGFSKDSQFKCKGFW